jgi:hypothetical protein
VRGRVRRLGAAGGREGAKGGAQAWAIGGGDGWGGRAAATAPDRRVDGRKRTTPPAGGRGCAATGHGDHRRHKPRPRNRARAVLTGFGRLTRVAATPRRAKVHQTPRRHEGVARRRTDPVRARTSPTPPRGGGAPAYGSGTRTHQPPPEDPGWRGSVRPQANPHHHRPARNAAPATTPPLGSLAAPPNPALKAAVQPRAATPRPRVAHPCRRRCRRPLAPLRHAGTAATRPRTPGYSRGCSMRIAFDSLRIGRGGAVDPAAVGRAR